MVYKNFRYQKGANMPYDLGSGLGKFHFMQRQTIRKKTGFALNTHLVTY